MSGYVYFVKPIGMDGPVKIGFSYAPTQRLETLMSWSPFRLEIVATVPGDLALERNIHECFLDLLSHREWFNAHPRLTAVMEKLRAGAAIEEALDLSQRVGERRAHRGVWDTDPMVRLQASYSHRMNRLIQRMSTDTHHFSLPDDAAEIMARWQGTYQFRDNRSRPSKSELARLDEVLANPHVHLRTRAA